MLEIETHMKNSLKIETEINPDTIPENCKTNKCWLCEKIFEALTRCSKCEKTGDPHLLCNVD